MSLISTLHSKHERPHQRLAFGSLSFIFKKLPLIHILSKSRPGSFRIRETFQNYQIRIFLPGFLSDEILVYHRHDKVNVTARSLAHSRIINSFIALKKPIVTNKMITSYEDSILTISVPKASSRNRKIRLIKIVNKKIKRSLFSV